MIYAIKVRWSRYVSYIGDNRLNIKHKSSRNDSSILFKQKDPFMTSAILSRRLKVVFYPVSITDAADV